jgi:hypothetical protein
MPSILYIDGLGLYYGSVRHTPWRWLDLEAFALAHGIDPPITRIRYFSTAAQTPEARGRQVTYLRALKTLRRVRVYEVEGTHAVAELSQRMREDERAGRMDLAVVLTIDGRVAPAIEALGTPSCALMPRLRKLGDPSVRQAATFPKRISKSSLETSLLPDEMEDQDGVFRKPEGW